MADPNLKTVIIGLAEDENATQNFRQGVGIGVGGGLGTETSQIQRSGDKK